MALKKLETTSNTSSSVLPFLNEYLAQLPKKDQSAIIDQAFLVEKMIAVKSKKGYILLTKNFSVFIWKKSKEESFLLENLSVENPFAIFIIPSNKEGAFQVAIDDEIPIDVRNDQGGIYNFLPHTF